MILLEIDLGAPRESPEGILGEIVRTFQEEYLKNVWINFRMNSTLKKFLNENFGKFQEKFL